MGNDEIKVKDLSNTSSLSTDNKLMLLTDEANNRVQNITVENALSNIISSNANNSLSVGSDKRLYTPDISGEVGDLDNLITTNKTDIVSAINEVKGATNAITGEVVSASKGWLEEGKIYQKAYWYGEKIYNNVYTYNHTTFDLSKFTKVGSPIITDDGVVLTADSSNYAQLNFDFSQDHTFEIETKGNNSSLSGAIRPFNNGYQIYINPNNSNRCLIYVNSGASYLIASITDEALKTNYALKIKIKKVGLVYTIDYIINGTITGTLTTTLATTPTYETYIRFQGSLDAQHSVDLKTLKISNANGIPIFSGNKTGIDIIKSADYTVVGTPTISADGIASGFSASDYITKTTAITLDKTTYFEFDVTFTTPSSWTKNGRFWAYGNKQNFGHTSGGVISGGFIGTGINQTGLSELATNTKYNAKYIYDENGFYISYKKANETTWISSTPATVTSTETQTLQGAIGNAFTDTSAYFTGSIDLNSIKFYVNGDLVYQPCLLIPYNESSTGSKIVDVAYRDRVIDVYEQYGSANYYTIDETNQNATLPMGEIYGFIEQVKENFSVPAYGNQDIAITIPSSPFTYTVLDDGFVYSDNITLLSLDSFLLYISRNGQNSILINIQAGQTETVQFPFFFPVLKGDIVATDLNLVNQQPLPSMYFVRKEGV